LSVPLTMVIKLGLDSRPETKWIAVLLGSGKAESQVKGERGKGKGTSKA